VIRLEGVSKTFGALAAVSDVSFEVPEGAVCVLLGASGCGKTTTLKMINRLVEKTGGRILLGGEDVDRVPVTQLRRRIGYVIQQVGLFPNMTVEENIGVVPRLLGWDASRIRRRAEELLAMLSLDPATFLARYPRQLSGGQQQRVGVARALAADPPVLLMDEPFGAVDPIIRAAIQDEFLALQRLVRKTVIMVSHDTDEAIKLGDRIAMFRAGRLVQYGAPADVLAAPADAEVASFFGRERILKRLSLARAGDHIDRPAPSGGAPSVSANDDLRTALAALLEHGGSVLAVRAADGAVLGGLSHDAVTRFAAADPPP
jgi:osmoprotectant transport system ATP-binding protein